MTPPNKIFPLREGPIETTESCRAPDLLHTRVEAADAVHACDITNVSWSPIQTLPSEEEPPLVFHVLGQNKATSCATPASTGMLGRTASCDGRASLSCRSPFTGTSTFAQLKWKGCILCHQTLHCLFLTMRLCFGPESYRSRDMRLSYLACHRLLTCQERQVHSVSLHV